MNPPLLIASGGPIIPPSLLGSAAVLWRGQPPLLLGLVQPELVEHAVAGAAPAHRAGVLAVAIGFAIAMALALVAHRYRGFEQPVIWFTSFLYTIPSLALFELLVPVPGLGLSRTTAEVALVAYTLLILFRNTLTGFATCPRGARRRRGGWE